MEASGVVGLSEGQSENGTLQQNKCDHPLNSSSQAQKHWEAEAEVGRQICCHETQAKANKFRLLLGS